MQFTKSSNIFFNKYAIEFFFLNESKFNYLLFGIKLFMNIILILSRNNSKTCQNKKVLKIGQVYIQNVSTGERILNLKKKFRKVTQFKSYGGLSVIPSFRDSVTKRDLVDKKNWKFTKPDFFQNFFWYKLFLPKFFLIFSVI